MKKSKLSVLDIICIGIAACNSLSFLTIFIFGNTFFEAINIIDYIITFLMLYSVFGTVLPTVVGIILNAVSLGIKLKRQSGIALNIVLFVVFIPMFPIWWHYFWIALMGV